MIRNPPVPLLSARRNKSRRGTPRRRYEPPQLRTLTFEQAPLFLVARSWIGNQGAQDLLRVPESNSLLEGLGTFVGLGKDAAFCDIAERFVDKASDYLQAVKRKVTLSSIKWPPLSLNPADFEH